MLLKEFGSWLAACIEFVDEGLPNAHELWTSLGVDAHWVEVLVDLKLHYKHGRLRVNAVADSPGAMPPTSYTKAGTDMLAKGCAF